MQPIVTCSLAGGCVPTVSRSLRPPEGGRSAILIIGEKAPFYYVLGYI